MPLPFRTRHAQSWTKRSRRSGFAQSTAASIRRPVRSRMSIPMSPSPCLAKRILGDIQKVFGRSVGRSRSSGVRRSGWREPPLDLRSGRAARPAALAATNALRSADGLLCRQRLLCPLGEWESTESRRSNASSQSRTDLQSEPVCRFEIQPPATSRFGRGGCFHLPGSPAFSWWRRRSPPRSTGRLWCHQY